MQMRWFALSETNHVAMTIDSTPPPTTTPPPDLGSVAVQDGMSQSMSAAYLLQVYTNTVRQTPDITLSPEVDTDSNSTVVEDLPTDQATARTNATYYLDTINPKLVAVTSQIIGYGNKYLTYYPTLVTLIDGITVGNNADQVVDGLTNLLNKATSCKTQADQVGTLLTNFLPLITTDAANLGTDSANVQTAMTGEGGEITQLQNQLDAYNKAMNKDVAVIAAGGAAGAIGLTCVLVGILGSAESGGTSIALVVFGLGCITAGSVVAASAIADYEQEAQNYKTTFVELENDQQIYAITQQASVTVNSLLDAVQGGVAAVTALNDAWSSLELDLQQVIDAVKRAPQDVGIWLLKDLADAYTEWQATVTLATNIQKNAVLPVQTVN
jgi:Bacillus haemolytic enterotoxin (HBL)